jgi:rhodanese-related sulfurtransferase
LAYLATLEGEKGYPDAGWLVSPYLLNLKVGALKEFRVIDLRPESAYEAGHVANAVRWAQGAAKGCAADDDTGQALGRVGVSEETFVVVYDEDGGREASCLWWKIVQAGHRRVGILDGGWKGWLAAGHRASRGVPKIEPVSYAPRPSGDAPAAAGGGSPRKLHLAPGPASADEVRINGNAFVGESGFERGPNLREYLQDAGVETPGRYLVEGTEKELSLLVFTLYLLGHSPVEYQGGQLHVPAGPAR